MLAALAACVYLGSLGNGFTFDDPHIVAENPLVTGEGGLGRIFISHYWAPQAAQGDLYRPLTLATYWLNYRVAGLSAWSYHLVNLVLHAAATAAAFGVFRRIGAGLPGATAAAVLFATHPVHVEAVASIVGRAELMAALFVLTAWRCRERVWIASGLFACALLSKENAVVLPGLLLIEDLVKERSLSGFARMSRLRAYLPYALVLSGYLALRLLMVGGTAGDREGPFWAVAPLPRILTAVRVLGDYLLLMIYPSRLSADYSYDQIPVVTSFLDTGVLVGAAAVALCAIFAVMAWRRLPLVSAGILFFFVALAPVSNVLFGIGVMMAERLLYLPSAGLCLSAGAALEAAVVAAIAGRGALTAKRVMAGCCLAAAIPTALLAYRTIVRTADWYDQVTLFEATVRTSPRSALAHVNLGSIYQSQGRLVDAEEAYRAAIAIAPNRPGPHYNLATVLEATGRGEEAIKLYREAARIDPSDIKTLNNLGRALLAGSRAGEAIAVLESAVALDPKAPAPRVDLAAAFLEAGDAVRAARIAREVLSLHPDDAAARRVLEASIARASR